MSDTALNSIIQYGTTAERVAFTPDPAVGSQVLYIWYDTDNTPDTYVWDGSAWVLINAAGGTGITELTGDVTAGPGSGSQAATIANNAVTTTKVLNANVTYAKIQDVSATSRALGRKTVGAGIIEELTLSELLDFIGSATQGDILFRGSATWARLAAGTSGQFLKTLGAGVDPVWDTAGGGGTSDILKVTGTLTDAQIRAMFGAPITLVAAVAGFIHWPVALYLSSNFSAGAYASGGIVNIYRNGVNPAMFSNILSISSGTTKQTSYSNLPNADFGGATASFVNTPLTVSNGTSAFTGGNAANTLAYTLYYRTTAAL